MPRYAVLLSVAVAVVYAAIGAAEALRTFDGQADRNASLAYLDRLYGDGPRYSGGLWFTPLPVIADKTVVEDALSTMPADATYRVVIGRRWTPLTRSGWTRSIEEDFLRFYLFPRRQTYSREASWAFCLACDPEYLGRRVQVVSAANDGMSFIRIFQ